MWLFIEERKVDDAFVVMQCSSFRNAIKKAIEELTEYQNQIGIFFELPKSLFKREEKTVFRNEDLTIWILKDNKGTIQL